MLIDKYYCKEISLGFSTYSLCIEAYLHKGPEEVR